MTAADTPATRQDLIRSYNLLIGGIEEEALDDEDRAYGGVIRAAKGKLVEAMTPHIIRLVVSPRDCLLEMLSRTKCQSNGNTLIVYQEKSAIISMADWIDIFTEPKWTGTFS